MDIEELFWYNSNSLTDATVLEWGMKLLLFGGILSYWNVLYIYIVRNKFVRRYQMCLNSSTFICLFVCVF